MILTRIGKANMLTWAAEGAEMSRLQNDLLALEKIWKEVIQVERKG